MQQRGAAPSFGRKGQGSSGMDARREAFIAAERARRQQEGDYSEPPAHDEMPGSRHALPKSIGTAYLLWFVLGQFGAHRFYVGSSSMAFAQIALRLVGILLVLSTNFFGLYLLGVAVLWWAVDGILLPDLIRQANSKTRGGSPRAFA